MGEKNYVYMVRCGNGSLYTGWTNDLGRRIRAHRTGKGAKYTRGFGAKGMVYLEQLEDKSAALRREAQLKALSKAQKEALVQEWCQENRPPIQLGGVEDAPQIAQLYRWYVSNSTATFQTSLPTDQEYGQWVEDTLKTAPLLVMKDRTGKLLGYACAHPFRPREAFRWDVETTIYCAHDVRGKGVGTRLMSALLAVLKMQGYWNAYALLADPNPDSEALHRRLGYHCEGRSPRTGYKLGAWQGLSTWCYRLREGEETPEEPNRTPDLEVVKKIIAEY